jgi:hypothetical protein
MKKTCIFLSVVFFLSLYSGNHGSYGGDHLQTSPSRLSGRETSVLKSGGDTPKRSSGIQESAAAHMIEDLPLYFVENKGQVDPRVRYQLRLSGMNAYFTPREIVCQIVQNKKKWNCRCREQGKWRQGGDQNRRGYPRIKGRRCGGGKCEDVVSRHE